MRVSKICAYFQEQLVKKQKYVSKKRAYCCVVSLFGLKNCFCFEILLVEMWNSQKIVTFNSLQKLYFLQSAYFLVQVDGNLGYN